VSGFEEAVTSVIASLVRGEVVTYGEVAAEAGYPGAARAVGSLLAKSDENLPWWRVVGSGGRLRSPDPAHQAKLLSADGVLVVGGRVMGHPGREYPHPG
jgi:methylated-DNA-protein-cysteine methyltransferase-like protein